MITLRGASLVALTAAALLLGGCKPSVVGNWTGSGAGSNQTHFEFKQDGTLIQTGSAPGLGNFEATATYKIDGEKMSIHVKDVTAGGKSILSQIPAALKPKVEEQFNQEATFKIEGDNLTMSRGGQSMTLTRVK